MRQLEPMHALEGRLLKDSQMQILLHKTLQTSPDASLIQARGSLALKQHRYCSVEKSRAGMSILYRSPVSWGGIWSLTVSHDGTVLATVRIRQIERS